MGIERNCPIRIVYAPTFQIFRNPVPEFKTTPVVEVEELEKLFAKLSEECKDWKRSDGEVWWDSPEAWLRRQLDLPRKKS